MFVTRKLGRKLEIMTVTGLQVVRLADLPAHLRERFTDPNAKPPPKVGEKLSFTALDGREFKGIIRAIAPDGISIETSDGLDKVAYSNLPAELANSFDFDADDAERFQAEQRRQQLAIAARFAAEQEAANARAAEERAAAEAAAAARTPNTDAAPTGAKMGERGSQRLGTPRLGGRGTGN
ncbi:MAG: hypothetical protein JWQ44_657 [Chthoniobacter sp.]|nr:hypothetical protein [Chthoniobacter sp.]